MNMKRQVCFLGASLALTLTCLAATPPPDKLLPADTLAVFTIPDYAKAKTITSQWPGSRLWADLSLKPFVDMLTGKIKSDLLVPLEREFRLKFSDFADLAQGQITLALTPNGWDGKSSQGPGFLLLL